MMSIIEYCFIIQFLILTYYVYYGITKSLKIASIATFVTGFAVYFVYLLIKTTILIFNLYSHLLYNQYIITFVSILYVLYLLSNLEKIQINYNSEYFPKIFTICVVTLCYFVCERNNYSFMKCIFPIGIFIVVSAEVSNRTKDNIASIALGFVTILLYYIVTNIFLFIYTCIIYLLNIYMYHIPNIYMYLITVLSCLLYLQNKN
jgi:hypothetical protein